MLLIEGLKVLEIALGAVSRQTRLSLVRVSIRDLGPDRNPSHEFLGCGWS